MLVELKAVEQRYRAVIDVLDGMSVTEVAQRNGVSRRASTRGCGAMPTEVWPPWPTRAPNPELRTRWLRSPRPGGTAGRFGDRFGQAALKLGVVMMVSYSMGTTSRW